MLAAALLWLPYQQGVALVLQPLLDGVFLLFLQLHAVALQLVSLVARALSQVRGHFSIVLHTSHLMFTNSVSWESITRYSGVKHYE